MDANTSPLIHFGPKSLFDEGEFGHTYYNGCHVKDKKDLTKFEHNLTQTILPKGGCFVCIKSDSTEGSLINLKLQNGFEMCVSTKELSKINKPMYQLLIQHAAINSKCTTNPNANYTARNDITNTVTIDDMDHKSQSQYKSQVRQYFWNLLNDMFTICKNQEGSDFKLNMASVIPYRFRAKYNIDHKFFDLGYGLSDTFWQNCVKCDPSMLDKIDHSTIIPLIKKRYRFTELAYSSNLQDLYFVTNDDIMVFLDKLNMNLQELNIVFDEIIANDNILNKIKNENMNKKKIETDSIVLKSQKKIIKFDYGTSYTLEDWKSIFETMVLYQEQINISYNSVVYDRNVDETKNDDDNDIVDDDIETDGWNLMYGMWDVDTNVGVDGGAETKSDTNNNVDDAKDEDFSYVYQLISDWDVITIIKMNELITKYMNLGGNTVIAGNDVFVLDKFGDVDSYETWFNRTNDNNISYQLIRSNYKNVRNNEQAQHKLGEYLYINECDSTGMDSYLLHEGGKLCWTKYEDNAISKLLSDNVTYLNGLKDICDLISYYCHFGNNFDNIEKLLQCYLKQVENFTNDLAIVALHNCKDTNDDESRVNEIDELRSACTVVELD